MDELKAFTGGVNNWVSPENLGHFERWFDLPIAPRSPFVSNRAAMARTYTVLSWNEKIERELGLQREESATEFRCFENNRLHDDPAYCCGVEALRGNMEWLVSEYQLSPNDMFKELLRGLCWDGDLGPRFRLASKGLQKKISTRLSGILAPKGLPEGYGSRLNISPLSTWRPRWGYNFTCLEAKDFRRDANTSLRNLKSLSHRSDEEDKARSCLPPSVHVAIVRLFYNGWPCAGRTGQLRHCCPICGMEQGDHLKHIMCCGVVRKLFAKYGVCEEKDYSARTFLLHDFRVRTQLAIQVSSVLITAIYGYLNDRRHGSPQSSNPVKDLDRYVDVIRCNIRDPEIRYHLLCRRIGRSQ